MAPKDPYLDLRTRAKATRAHAKHVLGLIKTVTGAQQTLAQLEDDADEVNVELAHDGDALFDFDVQELPALKADLVTFCRRVEEEAQRALEKAEAEL